MDPAFLATQRPWDILYLRAAQRLSVETQEMLASLLIELYPERVDELENATGADEREELDPAMRLDDLQTLIERAPARPRSVQVVDAARLDAALNRSLAEGIAVDDAVWARIGAVASRVLVPASEESRACGAGGGDANQ